MNVKLVYDISPSKENKRNSEGSFLRASTGEILFAYSAYESGGHDHAACNINIIRSFDEGETWSVPTQLVSASFFETKNIMSVSAMVHSDGSMAFYFLVKEIDGSSTIGRAISYDGGKTFIPERPQWNAPNAYYVINNDRFIRTLDGKIIVPAASYPVSNVKTGVYDPAVTVLLVSDDEGKSFYLHPSVHLTYNDRVNLNHGLQEPGIIELSQDTYWVWMRTGASYQYESYSTDGLKSFTRPEPSIFTSPDSPMQIVRYDKDTLYAVYNPIPNYNGRRKVMWWSGRTPFVIRKSTDNGKTFGELNVIENDEDRGYCYPAVIFTNDDSMLCAYCRGSEEDKECLFRLGIAKIPLSDIK